MAWGVLLWAAGAVLFVLTVLASWRVGDLTELADEKLRAGVSVSRLEFVLGQAEIEPICDREIEIHRMTVQTASGPSPVASAGFFGNRVIVTGETSAGQGADLSRSGTGAARMVNLRFLEIGGDVATASGPLPLAHALSVEGEELRFAIRSSDRSADELEISAQRCRLP
jgi:hypothetical protein